MLTSGGLPSNPSCATPPRRIIASSRLRRARAADVESARRFSSSFRIGGALE